MGLKTTFKRFFDLDEENETVNEPKSVETIEERPFKRKQPMIAEPTPVKENKKKIVQLQSAHQQTKMVLAEPNYYDDVVTLCDHIKNRCTVIVNMQRLSTTDARKVMDFMSGVIFALEGDIQKISSDTFICAPEHVDISGMISEFMESKN